MASAVNNPAVSNYRDVYSKPESIVGLELSGITQLPQLLEAVEKFCADNKWPSLLKRSFQPLQSSKGTDKKRNSVRIMQWNILAQALSLGKDCFPRCPVEALQWEYRRVRVLEEIIRAKPDIICLQEVDHFGLLDHILGPVGYEGSFFPKPSSPALYTEDNNGPDGCAVFYRTQEYELVKNDPIVLSDGEDLTNQVCIIYTFKEKATGKEFAVATTHLKAKRGWHELRHKQGSWLLDYLTTHYSTVPLVVTGDFNGESDEPVYKSFLESKLALQSTYALTSKDGSTEPPYTTFKIRETSSGDEVLSCRTIDYMWYTKANWQPVSVLSIPTDVEIGPGRLPSFSYPSDHFALAADYCLL